MKNKLNDNEVVIFTDFNNTLVDYANEYNYRSEFYEDFDGYLRGIKNNVTRALCDFEKKTGLTPVVCIVTNASFASIDGNGFNGLCGDLKMTFFNHERQENMRKQYEIANSCEKYFRYVIHKENDMFLTINPYGNNMQNMFLPTKFSDEALSICHKEKKRESVERLIHDIGPIKNQFVIFAGDSIQDDYPMKYGVNNAGLCKIFIRPGKITKMKESVMHQFCQAKGIDFDCVNPKNNKKVKCIDAVTIKYLSDEQKRQLFDYDDGDIVLLTNQNSKGFVEGIYKSIDIINDIKNQVEENAKQF